MISNKSFKVLNNDRNYGKSAGTKPNHKMARLQLSAYMGFKVLINVKNHSKETVTKPNLKMAWLQLSA
jgi:hypothetical protein